jgi:Tol biopolymer transport system component/DNA-binding winged helix-turn-helix (wHTH) protein
MAVPSSTPPGVVRFGVFELDLQSGELRKAGILVGLQEQSLKILMELLERPGELVTREQLRQRLWPDGTFVDFEHGLNAVINRLREALGDSAESPRFIQTVPRRGYRFIAPVEQGLEGQDVRDQPGSEPGRVHTATGDTGAAGPERAQRRYNRSVTWAAVVVAVAISAGVALYLFRLGSSPRGSMKTIPLTSLAGNERYPSFSPDGNQIAFVWDGEGGDNEDIYVKVIGTEIALRLTTGPEADRNPAWSPDGRHIAFVRSSAEARGLFVVPALGGPERKIQSLLNDWSAGPSWSPDAEFLALAGQDAPQAVSSIFIVSIRTLEKRKLTSPPASALGDFAPAFSPDGRTVAFNRAGHGGGIFLVPIVGGEPRRVTQEQHFWLERLAWTPAGRELIFSISEGAPESSDSLWRVPASGGTPERLAVGGRNAANPAVSSRGNRLAYEERRHDANVWKIAVRPSTQPALLPSQLIASTRHEAGPQFSPDGARIAFHSDRTGNFEIWVCDAAGSHLVQLTSFGGPMVGTPRWSPDGRRLAFDGLVKGNADIYLVNLEGGVPHRVTTEPSSEVAPSWSADGRWIYFASNRTGRYEVWKVPSAGGDAIQVTKRGGLAAFESRDGNFVYYAKGAEMDGVWKVAVDGGEEEEVLKFPQGGLWGYWALVDTGIYFVDTHIRPQPALRFLRFSRNLVEQVVALDRMPVFHEPGMAVSPDGNWILYTQEDHRSGDIMLVENFQ